MSEPSEALNAASTKTTIRRSPNGLCAGLRTSIRVALRLSLSEQSCRYIRSALRDIGCA